MVTTIKQRAIYGIVFLATLMLSSVLLSGCLAPAADNSAQATNMALAVQVTIAAMEKEQDTSSDDDNAQLTQVAQAVQATLNAAQPAAIPPTVQVIVEAAPTAEPADTSEPDDQQDLADFETWMKTADILLYEDMAGVYTTTRFVMEALDSLGLEYVDVKDAVGHFKDQLISGGPGGEGWDLIISAKEARGLVKGEIYTYINDNFNDGSSVIIEEWQLDSIVVGKVALLLNRCDVEWQDNWYWDPIESQLLWPVDGTLAIHHQPNEGIALTNPSLYWGTELGDFLRLAPGSKSDVLWTARANVKDSFIVAVSCEENRLIFQTYGTHSYGKDRIVRMWENYIYNTLLARYELLSE
jgi:hypothetical protein